MAKIKKESKNKQENKATKQICKIQKSECVAQSAL